MKEHITLNSWRVGHCVGENHNGEKIKVHARLKCVAVFLRNVSAFRKVKKSFILEWDHVILKS